MRNYVKYIQESYKKMKQYSVHGTPIVIKDEFVQDINLESIVKRIESVIPRTLVDGLDIIYIGHFDELDEKEVNALYLNGAIYVTNVQSSEEDLLNDIVHEFAHFVEEKFTNNIYGNSDIEREFLKKRETLFDILESEGYDVPERFRHTVEYDKALDDFFYKYVGYPTLRSLMGSLFISAYSVTDIREYFAISFETYFLESKNEVREITPSVYIVIEDILRNDYEI